MVRTQIQLTEEQSRALKRMASAWGVSVAQLIRDSVNALIRSSPTIDTEERRRRALAAAGRFHSGKADLSTHHDQYLKEALRS